MTTGSVGKGQCLQGKANPRFVVTNLPVSRTGSKHLYEKLYCVRGEMENRIKEQQLGLFADRTSTQVMQTNQLRLYFSSFAYVLMHGLRRLGLEGTAYAKAQCTTIRVKLLKIGARLRITARRVWLSFSEACPYARDIAQILANVHRYPAWAPPG
ncbi:MAG: transposase [Gammaproteobacteria bacterium]|nr:transposase [Gammaproteobacteria bacterium]